MVHAGTYRPAKVGQALIWFNQRHDGITCLADGLVVLDARNPELADRKDPHFPAVVNHVVYFGDGITSATILRGFRITGANGFVTRTEPPVIQPEINVPRLNKVNFFYTDGGGVKIFGRSFPTLDDLDIVDNYARPCGGGVSVEHRGFGTSGFVTFRNCLFRNNRCDVTGPGVDLLAGSAAEFHNCLFVNNIGNTVEDYIGEQTGEHYNAEHGSGALTVFADSSARVIRCTFVGNWNGVDDKSRNNVYRDSIFWQNAARGGISPGSRYELDVVHAVGVENCYVHGDINDLRKTVDKTRNHFDCSDPDFDADFVPRAAEYSQVGYRPTGRFSLTSQ